jgi:hypothetical protein
MTFADCLIECAKAPGFVSNFNRLTGRHLGEQLKRSPIEKMIDASTGYEEILAAQQDEDLRAFVEFCHETVWTRIPVIQTVNG